MSIFWMCLGFFVFGGVMASLTWAKIWFKQQERLIQEQYWRRLAEVRAIYGDGPLGHCRKLLRSGRAYCTRMKGHVGDCECLKGSQHGVEMISN